MDLNVTMEIPSIDLLEKIILDDNYFYEFSNNKNAVIYGFDVEVLQKHLKEYIISYMNNNKELSTKFLERAKYYNAKFNMDVPKFRKTNDGLDPDFYNYIISGIENLNNPLAKARFVYLKLAKVLCYDEHAPAYNMNLDNPIMQEMFYSRTSDVTLANNKVTCNLWATLYAEFLNKLGIEAKVVGEKHKLVEFTIEGVTYTADATNSFLDKDNIYLNDFTRVKLNSPTFGFSGVDKFDDQQISFQPSSLIEQYHNYSNNHAALSSMRLSTGDAEIDMIVAKLDYLSTMAYNLPQTEAVGYLRQMVRAENSIVSKHEVEKIMPRLIRLKDENDLNYTSLVIAIKNNDEYIYKLLNVPEGLITVEKGYFEDLIATGQMLDDGNIPGLNQTRGF